MKQHLLPFIKRTETKLTVVITAVARHLFPDEMGLFEWFILVGKLYFRYYQAFVGTMKFVDLKGMISGLYQPTGLVDDAWFAEHQQMFGLVPVDGSLKLIATQAAVERRTFNGEESLVIAKAHPHRPSVPAADIPLAYMAAAACLLLVGAVPDQELPLDFHSAHRPCR